MNQPSNQHNITVFDRIRNSLISKILIIQTLICFPLSGLPLGIWVSAEVNQTENQQNLAQFNELYDGIEFAIDQLDRTQFDLSALSETLEKDPTVVATWVRDHIAWVPYQGLLKGSEGTLIAGQGNSLDRAVLLARLLINEGYKTRVVGASVEKNIKSELKKTLADVGGKSWVKEGVKTADVDFSKWAEVTRKSEEQVKQDFEKADEIRESFESDVADTTQTFSDSFLGKLKLSGTPRVEGESHHYWVEYETEKDNWASISPVYLTEIPSSLLDAKTETYDRIADMPEELKHHVLIRFVIEKKEGEKVVEEVPLTWKSESWKIANKQVDFGFSGKHALEEESVIEQVTVDPEGFAVGLRESVLNETDWVPYVQVEDGASTVDQQFDLHGVLSDASESMGQGNVKALGKAVSMFGSMGLSGPAEPDGVLSSVRIEFEFHAPGSAVEKEVREIFNANLADYEGEVLTEAASNRRGEALGRQFNGLLLVGKVNKAWNDFVQLDTFLQTRMLANYLFRIGDEDPKKLGESLAKINKKISQKETALHALAVARMAESESFLGMTNLLCLSHHNKFSADGSNQISIIKGFDWIKNKIGVQHKDPQKALEIALLNGVRDTVLESELQERIGQNMLTNAVTVHDGILDSDDWIEASELANYANPEVERAIRADLDAGYDVFVSESTQGLQWWRIDSSTGETLGFAYAGDRVAGAAMTEYQIQLTLIAINTIKCLGGYYACARDKKGFGCYLCHWIGAAAGMIGAVASAGIGAIVSGVDGVAGTFCNVFG